MDSQIIVGVIAGFIVGGLIAFFLVNMLVKKKSQSHIEEMNAKADLQIQEARLSAKRLIDDAEVKAEKIISKGERDNENRRPRKITIDLKVNLTESVIGK